jgi:hypothetical protein
MAVVPLAVSLLPIVVTGASTVLSETSHVTLVARISWHIRLMETDAVSIAWQPRLVAMANEMGLNLAIRQRRVPSGAYRIAPSATSAETV